jgi:nucleotidyltransferase/DNA polymerase involved in DNA repair
MKPSWMSPQNKKGISSATQIAQQIRQQIFQNTGGLTASAGVSFNKFLAKVASDCNKPNGITVITPDQAPAFIDQLPIRKFFGVGKVTEERMLNLGIKTGADLKRASLQYFDSLTLARLAATIITSPTARITGLCNPIASENPMARKRPSTPILMTPTR